MDQQCERKDVDPNAGLGRRDLNSKLQLNQWPRTQKGTNENQLACQW